MRLRAALLNFAVPLAILIASYLVAAYLAALPPELAAFKVYGAYVFIASGGIVSLASGRGRVFFAILTLAIAYTACRMFLQQGQDEFVAYAVFAALCLFVPLNLGALSLLRERGILNQHGLLRGALLALQLMLTAWVALSRDATVVSWAYSPFLGSSLFAENPVPHLGLTVMALGLAASVAIWLVTPSAINLGFASAAVSFAIAAHGITRPHMFEIFVTAAVLILTVAVLQDTFRMAFRDELTGLPGRRALNERLAGLGRHYAVAMVDVDHFKSLNDTYGHDVGDQVLKMVATRLAQAGGGGVAYRYGGEEFTLLFPGKSTEEAMPHLEALRAEIAGYGLALRRPDRPVESKSGRIRRGGRDAERLTTVTVSIGVAERNARASTPDDVVRAADKSLYRAKSKGRNRVSR